MPRPQFHHRSGGGAGRAFAALVLTLTLTLRSAPAAPPAATGNSAAPKASQSWGTWIYDQTQPVRDWVDAKPTDLVDPSKRSDPLSQAQVGVSATVGSAVEVYKQGGTLMQSAGVDPGNIPLGSPPPKAMADQLWRYMKDQTTLDPSGATRKVYPNVTRADARDLLNKVKERARILKGAGDAISGGAIGVEMGYRASQGDYSGAVVHGVNNYVKVKIGAAVGGKVAVSVSGVATPWVGVPVGIIAGVLAGWGYDEAQKATIGTPDEIANKITVALAPGPTRREGGAPTQTKTPEPTPSTPLPPAPSADPEPTPTPTPTPTVAAVDERPPGYPAHLPWPPGAGADPGTSPPPNGGTGKGPSPDGGTPTVAGGNPDGSGVSGPSSVTGTDPTTPTTAGAGSGGASDPATNPGTGKPAGGTKSVDSGGGAPPASDAASAAARDAARRAAQDSARTAAQTAARNAAKPPPTAVRPKPVRPKPKRP